MYVEHHEFHAFRAKVQCIINFLCHLNLDHGICNNIVTLQNIGGVEVSVYVFFLFQNFSAIISNKIKFLTHISLIGKSRLGFLPNGNPPLHGFQYNTALNFSEFVLVKKPGQEIMIL